MGKGEDSDGKCLVKCFFMMKVEKTRGLFIIMLCNVHNMWPKLLFFKKKKRKIHFCVVTDLVLFGELLMKTNK